MEFPEIEEIFMRSTQQRPAVDELLRLQDVRKVYGRSRNSVTALAGVSLGFRRHTFTAVMGPSGSGKSTFLHCAALLDRPTSGGVFLEGQDLTAMSERALTKLRRNRIGFVFQSFRAVRDDDSWHVARRFPQRRREVRLRTPPASPLPGFAAVRR
jgi:ABC-type proline/glycine betaine transport system ATPase subunit